MSTDSSSGDDSCLAGGDQASNLRKTYRQRLGEWGKELRAAIDAGTVAPVNEPGVEELTGAERSEADPHVVENEVQARLPYAD